MRSAAQTPSTTHSSAARNRLRSTSSMGPMDVTNTECGQDGYLGKALPMVVSCR